MPQPTESTGAAVGAAGIDDHPGLCLSLSVLEQGLEALAGITWLAARASPLEGPGRLAGRPPALQINQQRSWMATSCSAQPASITDRPSQPAGREVEKIARHPHHQNERLRQCPRGR